MEHYVNDGKTAGMVGLIAHRGKLVQLEARGYSNIASQTLLQKDSLFRIYSMTKAVTSVGLMRLIEQGTFNLDDAAHRWIPALKNLKVYRPDGGLDALDRDITIRQLLTHTAGFSYGFEPEVHPVDKMYWDTWSGIKPTATLSEAMAVMLKLPLIAQPGRLWHYSIATDICGYLIELIADMPFDEYLQQTILDPLGMVDTAFEISPDKQSRLASLYGLTEEGPLTEINSESPIAFIPHTNMQSVSLSSGGGGLLSTAHDYWQFAQMMLNRGELNGQRIISAETVALMTQNQLAPDLLPIAFNGVTDTPDKAYGFGLGYCINMNAAEAPALGSNGDFSWGGAADTYCWVDPEQELVCVLMQQYFPSLTHAGRRDFRDIVYQGLVGF